ncbi:uncharacterized protein [Halyomorpha halys]|uniref:uncharacterized protein n=1 Tax=Halyomorpha halys TaxID=286706 RepID=UPI0006D5074D|nr:uncharacterized protein LOC106687798 [Halyomorpha halys]
MVLRVVALLAVVVVIVVAAPDQGNSTEGEETNQVQEVEEQRPANILPSLIASSVALFQGRGKKGNQGLGMAMMMGGMMIALALAALAALSGKAMAASMAALMLAAMSLLKKHSGGGHHSSYEVISVPGGHHHRSLAEGYAHEETYSEEVAERLSSGHEAPQEVVA